VSLIDPQEDARGLGMARGWGLGLSLAGAALPWVPAGLGGEVLAAACLAPPAAAFALLLAAPDAFAISLGRGGARTINPILLAAPLSLLAAGSQAGVFDASPAIAPAAIVALIAVLVGFGAASRPLPGGLVAGIVFLALFGGSFGYGAMVLADRRFDEAEPQRISVQSDGRIASFSLDGRAYRIAGGGRTDDACIAAHPGALKMPWGRFVPCVR
jgi:hypothetical protein